MRQLTHLMTAAIACLGLAFAGVLVTAGPASAATLTVLNANDSGPGSLRDVLTTASTNGDDDTIQFTAGLSDIILTTGPISLSGADDIIIDGTGSPLIQLGGATTFMFTVAMSGDLTITEVLLDGAGFGGGFAISTVGSVSVTDSSLINFTTTDEGGAIGALTVTGDVEIVGSLFDSNSAVDPGGAIYLGDVAGALTIDDSLFTNNSTTSVGGAIFGNDLGTLTVTDSSFADNTASVSGGALGLNGIAGDGRIELTEFEGNSAGAAGPGQTQGGAIFLGTVASGTTFTILTSTIRDSTLIAGTLDPRGAGLFAGDIDGTLIIDSSTFAANTVSGVADGISVGVCTVNATGLFRVINSTFDETASATGWAIDVCTNDGEVEVLFSTLVGPGILRIGTNGGDALVSSSIVDGDNAGVNALNIDGAPLLVEWSTVSMPAGVFGVDEGAGVQFLVTDPRLGPLQDNGGPTLTRLLRADSPALDRGDPAVAGAPATDQRRTGYPRIIGGRIDIGAIEMPRSLPATGSESPLPALIGGILLVIVGGGTVIVARIRRHA